MTPKISVLLAARKNSKYLAKFLFGFLEHTNGFEKGDVDIHVMLNVGDTWNRELVDYFSANESIMFYYENKKLGRAGLNEYFNEMIPYADGEWIIYFCDDHFITEYDWDLYFNKQIIERELDPDKPYCIVPKFHNVGAMNQMLSRAYVKAIGGIGRHGNIDSYVNDVNRALGGELEREVVQRLDNETFYDFTHDRPSQLDDSRTKTEISDEGLNLPKYNDHIVKRWIEQDAQKVRQACSIDTKK